MKRIITSLLFVLAIVFACFAKGETATVIFTVNPPMSCQNCENKIKTNIRFEKGVTEIVTNLKAQTVTITYNPTKTNPQTLISAFKKIGYTATETGSESDTQVNSEKRQ